MVTNCDVCEEGEYSNYDCQEFDGGPNYFPSSNSYPFLMPYNHPLGLSPMKNYANLHVECNKSFTKSSSSYSFSYALESGKCSSSYLDCRLRYMRQTRRLQKYLRVTPEGHLLVNDIGSRSADVLRLNQKKPNSATWSDEVPGHSLETLISAAKLKKIYAAFWNLEPKQDVSHSNSLQQIDENKPSSETTNEAVTEDKPGQ
ncbi:unnamed protein product [Dicrocoelium dendriticum]|nr:unnamed protein product [Dicrocoelium dendriticum]